METKQQTAVDWLFKKLWDTPKDKLDWYAILAQAKEMEKEQIVESYSHGWHDGQNAIIEKIKHIDLGGDAAGDVHYTQTYVSNRDYKTL